MGEEIDLDKSQSSDSFSLKSSFFSQAAKFHGHQESSETSGSVVGLNQAFVSRTDYDKICLSLSCGLPNEQELALNVCTILSNEGNYMLHLEQAPKLVDLLVAQTGVFPAGDDGLKMLYLESWKNLKGRNMHRFWRSTVDPENTDLMELLGLDLGDYDPHCKLLNLESELGAHNVEGQRVLRIALILHNLSFEKYNVSVLINSRCFMRFMLLCIHSSWGNLKQVAYDTLSNLASAIKLSLEKDVSSRLIFRTVVDGILSYDRYMNIRSMDILAQLCSHESNEDVIPLRLEVEVYQQMVAFLTVRDIMLLFYTLEALYALSDLGRYACDKIVSVHRCIGALVSLLTLEPTEYGAAGQINMKVVKTLVPADADGESDCTGTVVEDTPVSTAVVTATTSSATVTTTNIIESVDADVFAMNWLKSTYEASPGNSISRNELYSDYLACCTKAGRKDNVNANVFADCVRKTFPMCGVKKFEHKGIITFHHDGLQKKGYCKLGVPISKTIVNTPISKVSTTSTPITCKTPQKTTFNSILKSQLSSAPKILPSTPVRAQSQVITNQKIQPTPQSPVLQRNAVPSTPTNAGSSTLIKSLLASKVQQRNLQQQVVPSNVSKMVIYSPGGSGLIGPHTTVVRCIRPGALHAVNIGSSLRSPIQTCLVSNNARIITGAAPRFVKNTTVIRHTLQPQVIKQGVVTSTSATRINGLPKDLQLVDDENIKTALVAASPLSQVIVDQSQVQHNLDNTQHSILANGDTKIVKSINLSELNLNPASVIQNSELQKLIGTRDLAQSESSLLITSKPITQVINTNVSNSNVIVENTTKDIRESVISFESKKDSFTNLSIEQPNIQHSQQKDLSSPTSILKSVLSDLDSQSDELKKQQQQQQQRDILKRAPLLNGLLDKGKLPFQSSLLTHSVQTNTVQNSVQTNTVQNVMQTNTVQNTVQTSTVQNAVQTNTLQNTLQTNTLQNAVQTNTLQNAVQTNAFQNAVLANVAQNAGQTNQVLNAVQTNTVQNTVQAKAVLNVVQANTVQNITQMNAVQANNMQSVVQASNIQNTVQASNIQNVVQANTIQNAVQASALQNALQTNTLQNFVQASILQNAVQGNSVQNTVLANALQNAVQNAVQTNAVQNAVQANTVILNGNEPGTMEIINSKENKPTQFVQLNQNSFVIPVSSLNTVLSAPQSNLIFMPVSSINPVISSMNPVISSSSLNAGILATSSVNSSGTFISSSSSAAQLSVPNPVMPSNTFLSNGSNVMQLCIGDTTLSTTVEVQSDQQGVVRLHIESPENSNQGSDLSSISDITRTLECASKALLKTNAECSAQQVSFSGNFEALPQLPVSTPVTTIVSSIATTTSPSALTRTGQQFFVVTPSLNQPQLQIQQPNFKFHILHSIPKIEESVDLISFPTVNISQANQLQLTSSETTTVSTTSLKRPSSDTSTQLIAPNAKKPCMENSKSLLSESLRTPTSVPCTLTSSSVNVKPLQDTKSFLLNTLQTEKTETVSKLTTPVLTPKTVLKHVPKVETLSEKVTRTYSGLSSVNNTQSNSVPSQVPKKSPTEFEFLCEWKNCGLKFKNPSSVFLHATKSHAPLNSNDLVCLWEGCESIKRRRLSHLTHLQDWHCNDTVLQTQAMRRKQITQTGKSSIPPPQKPPPHPGYAPDAALLAIKRHALQYINPKELSEEKESVLTKSIRLTSALILRNLVTHSHLARTYLRRFEPDIAYLAMSPVESARTLAQCLSQLYTTHD